MSSLHYLIDNDVINMLHDYVKTAKRNKSEADAREFHHENFQQRQNVNNNGENHARIIGTLGAIQTFLKKQFPELDLEWAPISHSLPPSLQCIMLSVRNRVTIYERYVRIRRKLDL